MKQTGLRVGVSFKRETPTPTPGQKPDSGGLRPTPMVAMQLKIEDKVGVSSSDKHGVCSVTH